MPLTICGRDFNVDGRLIRTARLEGDGYKFLEAVFAHEFHVFGVTLPITVIWWLLFVVLSGYILQRTKIGNWIYAVGGNAASARAVGVPVTRVKIGLFMTVAFLGWFYCLALGRMNEGMRNISAWLLRYEAQTWAYVFLLTGRYPSLAGAPTA